MWVRIIGESVTDESGNVIEIQGALQDITDSKLAEAEIRSLATRLTTTLESITDAFFTVDRDWKFTYVNRKAENILQKSRDHRSNLYNDAPMPYMQRLTWDGIALHGGALPGYPASHGCVRVPRSEVGGSA